MHIVQIQEFADQSHRLNRESNFLFDEHLIGTTIVFEHAKYRVQSNKSENIPFGVEHTNT